MRNDLSGNSSIAIKDTQAKHLTAMEVLHGQLSKLPKNPYKDDTPNLHAMQAKAGKEAGTDFAMFLLAGFQQAALGVVGVAAHSMLSTALDVGTSMMTDAVDKPLAPPVASKNDKKTGLTYRPKFRRAQQMTPKAPAPAGATSMLKNAARKKQFSSYMRHREQRRALTTRMTELQQEAEVMKFYMQDGVYDIYDSAEANGQKVKTKKNNELRFVAPQAQKKQEQRVAFKRKHPGLTLGMAA